MGTCSLSLSDCQAHRPSLSRERSETAQSHSECSLRARRPRGESFGGEPIAEIASSLQSRRATSDVRRRDLHRRRARAARALLHEPRRARLRADQPAGDGQGRAVRALLAVRQDPAAAVPRRVRRQDARLGADGRAATTVGVARAEKLYDRVFNEYGDDSVAQLGGVHIACEYVSNVLTKVLEWGRLMAYLEQSTRYMPYTDKLHGRWRYHVPAEIVDGALRERYVRDDGPAFETYAKWIAADAGALRGALPEERVGLRRRPSRRDPRQGARHAARHAAGGDAVERRHLRHRPGVRGAAAAHARASARGVARLRRR